MMIGTNGPPIVKRVPHRLLDIPVGDRDIGQVPADVAQVADGQVLDVGIPIGRVGRVVPECHADRFRSAGRTRRRDRGRRIGRADQPGIDWLREIPERNPVADARLRAVLPWRALGDRGQMQVGDRTVIQRPSTSIPAATRRMPDSAHGTFSQPDLNGSTRPSSGWNRCRMMQPLSLPSKCSETDVTVRRRLHLMDVGFGEQLVEVAGRQRASCCSVSRVAAVRRRCHRPCV